MLWTMRRQRGCWRLPSIAEAGRRVSTVSRLFSRENGDEKPTRFGTMIELDALGLRTATQLQTR